MFLQILVMGFIPLALIHVTYFIAVKRSDFSVIDTAWGLNFMALALTGCLLSEFKQSSENLLFLALLLWGLRLSWFLHQRNRKLGEDARYRIWREEWGDRANVIGYFKIFLLQYVLMLLVALPIFAVHFLPGHNFSNINYVGVLLFLLGLIWESVADFQKNHFKQKNPKAICTVGLWSLSRHPNYFGEATLWYGLGLMAFTPNSWWSLLGPLFLNFLLVKVSGIPLTEKKQRGNPDYERYKKTTPPMIPDLAKLLKLKAQV